MGSRRVPGWGIGGRSGGDSEDDGPVWTPSPASRSYLLSVRPETRSTFCSIIAQLTEETQPLFETTLKSRAVSEDSDVRFTCIVTGYPEPEVTWYKDDTELDRYCGLPKYKITHQGNRHTLQLYRCQEEDAAIYQASARNTKGIVSCSGVLEVGTMTEYKIHQRWFAKLKRKAAAKMRELEQSWRQGKEFPGEAEVLRKLSPDRFQRKRRLSGPGVPIPSAPCPPREAKDEAPEVWQEGKTESVRHPGLGLVNNFAAGGEAPTNGEPAPENGEDREHGLLTYICEAMELEPSKAPQKESGAKKKRKDRESKLGLRTLVSEKTARGHKSAENCVSSSDKADSGGTQRPVGTEQVQAQCRSRAAWGSGSSRTDTIRKPAPAVDTQDKAHDGPAQSPVEAPDTSPAPGPGQEGFFSLKDLYVESTLEARPQGQGEPLPPSAEGPPGKVLIGSRGAEMSTDPGQHTPSVAPHSARPFNRKRFAPPKPKGEPHTDSQPASSLKGAPDCEVQNSRQALPQASAQVPTPPARWKHSSRDSPVQGRAGHRPSGEEPQATTAQTMSASNSSSAAPTGHSSSGNQRVVEPMDIKAQEDRRTHTDDRRTRGRKSPQVQVVGRTEGERAQAAQRTQVDVVMQESESPQSDRSSQKDVVMQRRVETQVERILADERTQENRRMQEGEQTQPEGSVLPATESHPEQQSVTSLSPLPRAPESLPSEGPRSSELTECPTQTPEASSVPEEPGFVLTSEEPPVNTSGSHEDTVLGPLPASFLCPAQLPCEGSSEHRGGERHLEPEESGPAKAEQEVQPGAVPFVALGGCPTGSSSLGVSIKPSLPGPGLTNNLQEELPSTPAPQPTDTAGHQAGLSSVPTMHQGPEPHTQSPLLETVATSSKGACAKEPIIEDSLPASRSCDPGLIDSLKNYLLLLLKLSSTESGEAVTESPVGAATVGTALSPPLVPTVEVAGLSPRTSRRILERVENNHLVQSAETLLLSPCTSRRLTSLLDQEVQAGRQALASAQAARGPGPSPLSVPAIVVGEEVPGVASEGSLEGPGLQSGQVAETKAHKPCQEEREPGEALPGLPAATPEELALGARRKRFVPKVRAAGDGEVAKSEERESPSVSPRGPRKNLAPGSPGTPGRERRSPTQGKKAMLEVPRAEEEPVAGELGSSPKAGGPDAEPALDEDTQDPVAKTQKAKDLLKAPQVIRKIRVEQFPDASGSLKLWCQFFNILNDSVLTWAKDQHPVGEVNRSAGDEGPAALAIVQASPVDCGVYRCTIHNEHGSASTDFCLSPEVLSGFISREEGEVGEEIEMTPMVFAKGLADSGCWGDKLFGRLVSEELRGGGHGGGLQKASRAKVIYGLEPIFESGRTCIIKVSSLLVFGPSSETSLLGRNYDVTIQGCKIQNMSREYCKIFAAEARAAPSFGEVPEIVPLYLIYRPANTIPYATLEEDLGKSLQSYCSREGGCTGAPAAPSSSEIVQKCQAFQHWLYQWTNGSFLVTDLAGVDWKMTDVRIATKLRGYQGLKESCFPALLNHFASSHQCNAYCEMLGLTALKGPEASHPQAKPKVSKSPSAGRKGTQLSPQPQKKGPPSPQGTRRSTPSPKATSQASEAAAVPGLGQPPSQEGGSKAHR
ncbi:alpha-protein kinase 3 isoform X2 [Fukomys damarensis]|uniref:Alpha-protein kinase 3 n=1 Tax=Fukomys damarensis TaxID=885580 RepID=A0A091DWG6_FUKDA|nr:alpha-protein kinase 3 isoform X2 [Fukomys damarensis]KFO34630.1 Alpha-protein kinase 3 [Fukomys damarensis]